MYWEFENVVVTRLDVDGTEVVVEFDLADLSLHEMQEAIADAFEFLYDL